MRPRRSGFACPARALPERSRSGKTPVLRGGRVARVVRAKRSFASTLGKLFEARGGRTPRDSRPARIVCVARDPERKVVSRVEVRHGQLLEPSPVVLVAHLSGPLCRQDRDPARSIPQLPRSTVQIESIDDAALQMLQLGGEAEVLEPQAVRDALHAAGARMGRIERRSIAGEASWGPATREGAARVPVAGFSVTQACCLSRLSSGRGPGSAAWSRRRRGRRRATRPCRPRPSRAASTPRAWSSRRAPVLAPSR